MTIMWDSRGADSIETLMLIVRPVIMKIYIIIVLFIIFVIQARAHAEEINYTRLVEVHLGCNDSEAEADLIHSAKKITENAKITGVHIIYKEKTDYCGYKLIQTGKKPKMIFGATTGINLWLALENYFLIKRPKKNRKIDGLGYPVE